MNYSLSVKIDTIDKLLNNCIYTDNYYVNHYEFINKIYYFLYISSFEEQIQTSVIKICDKIFQIPPGTYYDKHEFNYINDNFNDHSSDHKTYKIQIINEFYTKYEFLRVYCDYFNYID
jgi:hypothetical protein